MRKTVNLSSLINDCVAMIQMAGGIVRSTHAASAHMLPPSRLSLVDRLKAATSVNECDFSMSDTEQE